MIEHFIQLQHKESGQWRDFFRVNTAHEGLTKIKNLMIDDRFNRYRLIEKRVLVLYPL